MNRTGQGSVPDRPGQPLGLIILDGLTRTGLYVSCLSLFLLLTAYIYEVGARYFFNVPSSWSYDFSTWCLAICIMLALPEVTRSRANITIDFLLEYLSPGPRLMARRIIFFLAFGFCLTAAWVCGQETWRQFSNHIETNWTNPIPKWWVSLVVPIGFVLCAFQFFRLGLGSEADRTTARN